MAIHSDVCQVRTSAVDGSGLGLQYIGTLGHVQGLNFGSILPGGDNQCNFSLQLEPNRRPEALNPGRVLDVLRGASVVWQGHLTQAVPSADGWTVTGTGLGVHGADFQDSYTDPFRVDSSGTSVTAGNTAVNDSHAQSGDVNRMISGDGIPPGAVINTVNPGVSYSISLAPTKSGHPTLSIGGWTPDAPVDRAISWYGGLRWINPGVQGAWWINSADIGSITITDHMNEIMSNNGNTWFVDKWRYLNTGQLPSDVTHLLVVDIPAARTLYGNINNLWFKYISSDDGQGNVTYGFSNFLNDPGWNKHGAQESYIDITSAGVLTFAEADQVAANILSKYTRAAWAGAFNVRHGQLLSIGGAPVDLAVQRVGNMVCRMILTDFPFGGEIEAGPIEFPVGEYVYDDDSQTAAITPVQSYRTDIGSVLSETYKWAAR
jgi:hypothetical protein